MKRQRGGIVFDLVIAAAVGGLLIAATIWVNHFIDTTWVDPAYKRGHDVAIAEQIAADTTVLEKVKAERDEALARSAHAQADTAACVATSATQSSQVAAWKAEAARRTADASRAKAEGAAASQSAKVAIARYQEIAARPPVKDQTCEQKLEATDKLLRDAARARAAAKAGK